MLACVFPPGTSPGWSNGERDRRCAAGRVAEFLNSLTSPSFPWYSLSMRKEKAANGAWRTRLDPGPGRPKRLPAHQA